MAGGWGSTFANDILKLIFLATAIANIADNAATSPITNIEYALHTASPSGGSQTTSEATYGSYQRVPIARTSGGHTASTNTIALAALLSWPTSTGTPSETLTHFSAGTAHTGTGKILFWGTLTPNITMNASGITPQMTTASWLSLGT